jgi:hypothetical protein
VQSMGGSRVRGWPAQLWMGTATTHTLVGERAMEATVRLPWYRSATLVKPVATASGGLRPGLCASPHTVRRHPFDYRNTHLPRTLLCQASRRRKG